LFFLIFATTFFFPINNVRAAGDWGSLDWLRQSIVAGQNFETSNTPNTDKLNDEKCNFLSTPGKCLLLPLFYFSGLLLRMSGALFTWIIDTRNVSLVLTNPAVFEMWGFVRDLLNMVFILVLLFSAFCTIFQVERYNYKKLLWKIVLMALLVNFSFPITRFIIDFSNILMYAMINSDLFTTSGTTSGAVSSFGNIAKNSSLVDLMKQSAWTDASSLLAATVMLFMLAVTFLAVGVLLLIRIIALTLLIIFSPIAFVGPIMPGFESFASKWWTQLSNYAFFGPNMIVGIVIAVKFMNVTGKGIQAGFIIPSNDMDPTYIANILSLFIPIVLLWLVMGIAQSMSIAGAGVVMGAAQKVIKGATLGAGLGLGKFGAHWLNRKMAETKGLRYLSPMAMKEAWKARTARQDRKALAVSSGAIQNTLNKVIDHAASVNPFIAVARFARGAKKSGLKGGVKNIISPSDADRTDYNFMELQRFANEEKERLTKITDNSDQVLHEMNLAIKRAMPGDAGTVMAAHASLAKTNDLNEHQAAHGQVTDPQVLKLTLAAELFAAGMKSSENIAKSLMITGENAFSANNYAYGGMGKFLSEKDPEDDRKEIKYNNIRTLDEFKQFYNPKTGEIDKKKAISNSHFGQKYLAGYYLTTEDEQAKAGAAKFSNLETQSRQRLSHPDTFYNIDNDGNVVDIHLGGLKTFEKFNAGDVENAGRARETVQRHAQAWDLYNKDGEAYEDAWKKAHPEEAKDPVRLQELQAAFKKKIDDLDNATIVIEHLKKASNIINKPPEPKK
jgi:hypothetical protein